MRRQKSGYEMRLRVVYYRALHINSVSWELYIMVESQSSDKTLFGPYTGARRDE